MSRINLTHKKNRQEFILSIILLSLIILISAALLIKQSKYDLGSYGIVSGGRERAAVPEQIFASIQVERMAPKGFMPFLKTETYIRENLHEKINGKATLYLESGFRRMTAQRYAESGNSDIWLELFIYDMGEYKNAFSVYSQQKRADAVEAPDLGKAYTTPNSLYIVLGRYYVEISGSSRSESLARAIPELGHKIKSELKSPGAENIEDIPHFEKAYIVPGSEKQYLKGAFGYSGFKDISTARYKVNGSVATVFIGDAGSGDEAKKTSEGYYNFLIDNGGELKATHNGTGLRTVNLYGYYEAVTSCGKYVAGIHEAENFQDAEKISGVFITKICGKKK